MVNEYEIYTLIPINFDPGIEGITLDSIVETSKGYIEHSIPFAREYTMIRITTSGELEEKYIRDQLDTEFEGWEENGSVIKEIRRIR